MRSSSRIALFVDRTEFTVSVQALKPVNSPDKEKILVSLQRLSRCNSVELGNAKPWLGHGKARKQCQIRKRLESADAQENHDELSNNATQEDNNGETATRQGRRVRKPTRYRVYHCSCPEGSASQQGGSCKEPTEEHVRLCRHVRKARD